MRLILLRHGLAVERTAWTGDDADRPLTAEGRLRTRAVVRAARALVRPVDCVWTSPYARAHATAVLGRQWTTDPSRSPEPPTLAPWRRVEVIPIEPPLAPTFTKNLEFRPTGMLPFSGGTEASKSSI